MRKSYKLIQPPSSGCVLKQYDLESLIIHNAQPPSSGCVLKHFAHVLIDVDRASAAFERLCVET